MPQAASARKWVRRQHIDIDLTRPNICPAIPSRNRGVAYAKKDDDRRAIGYCSQAITLNFDLVLLIATVEERIVPGIIYSAARPDTY